MEQGKMWQLSDSVADKIYELLEGRIHGMCTYDIDEDPNNEKFTIRFVLYNFWGLKLIYDKGLIDIRIINGGQEIIVPIYCNNFYEVDMARLCKEVDEEIRLRIPDKYLEKYGWL